VYIPLLKIGSLQLETPLLLAPLANVSDGPFRLVCRRNGAALVYTEMLSAEGIVRGSCKTWDLARFTAMERPIGIQLFSPDPDRLAEAAARLEVLEPDLFDINCGCPVRKVLKTGAGASFMEDPGRIAAAVRSVAVRVHRPVTVKFRSGPSAERLTVIEAARAAEAEGAAAVTVHARTTQQGFSGRADWDVIAQVKDAVKVPVIGNGDVFSPRDMRRMFEQTGCDAVMIGRGALGSPWIFAACQAELRGEPWQPPSSAKVWAQIEFHYQVALEQKGKRALWEMRKHLGWYSKGLPGAAEFRAHVFRLEDADAVLAAARQFFINQSAIAV